MGWLTTALHVLSPISNLFNTDDHAADAQARALYDATQAQTAATKAASDQATSDAAAALKAQQDANLIAAAAAVPASDSESARGAGDDQRRKLTQGSNFGIGLPDKFGAPPVGFRMLSGQ